MKTIKETKTTTITSYVVSGQDIINALKKCNILPAYLDKQEIFVRVPGGGDWSNMALDLMENNVIITHHRNENA